MAQTCQVSNSSWPERCDSAVSHGSGFPYKPPLRKWDFNACPRDWEQLGQGWLGCWGGQGTRWPLWDDASPRAAGLLAAAFPAARTQRGCFSAGPVLLVSRCLQMLSFRRHGQMSASS